MFHDNRGATIATYELPTIEECLREKSYDVYFKLKGVERAEKTSNEAATREMGVDTKQILEWSTTHFSRQNQARTNLHWRPCYILTR